MTSLKNEILQVTNFKEQSLVECFDPQIFIAHQFMKCYPSVLRLSDLPQLGLLPFLPDDSNREHSLQSNLKPLPKEASREWVARGDTITIHRASPNRDRHSGTSSVYRRKGGGVLKGIQECSPKVHARSEAQCTYANRYFPLHALCKPSCAYVRTYVHQEMITNKFFVIVQFGVREERDKI